MQVVIFAAGKGTRMRFLTENNSKVLLKVLGVPILEYNLRQLNNLVDEVILVVGYKGTLIREYFGNRYKNLKIRYVVQKEQLGTGHAARQALPLLQGYCLFMNGDDLYSRDDLQRLLKKFPSILVARAEHPERFGVVNIQRNRVIDLEEKPKRPKSNLVNIGAYFLDPSIFRWHIRKSMRGEYEFTDYVRQWVKRRNLFFVVAKQWIPISSPESLHDAEKILKRRNAKNGLDKMRK